MYIIGVDNDLSVITMLERMLGIMEPDGEHRFYSDPLKVINELDKPIEVAFINIETPGMNGLELAKKIIKRYPLCNIIFISDRTDNMPEAFEMNASDYLLKPLSPENVKKSLLHRRYRTPDSNAKPLCIKCFGNFEVYSNNEPIKFKRQKSKETLAFLTHKRGALCTMDMLIGNIEPEKTLDKSSQSIIRVYIGDIIYTLLKHGIEGIVTKSSGAFGINTQMIDCDYYRYLEGDPYAISLYTGEYMTQYSFAEETRAFLEMKYYNTTKTD